MSSPNGSPYGRPVVDGSRRRSASPSRASLAPTPRRGVRAASCPSVTASVSGANSSAKFELRRVNTQPRLDRGRVGRVRDLDQLQRARTPTRRHRRRHRQRQRQRGRARPDLRRQQSVSVTSSWSSANEPVTVSRPANSIDALPSTCSDSVVVDVEPERQPVWAPGRSTGVGGQRRPVELRRADTGRGVELQAARRSPPASAARTRGEVEVRRVDTEPRLDRGRVGRVRDLDQLQACPRHRGATTRRRHRQRQRERGRARPDLRRQQSSSVTSSWSSAKRAGHRQQAGELDRRVALDVQRQRRRRCRARTAARMGGRVGRRALASVSVAQSSFAGADTGRGVQLQLPVGHRQRQRRELEAKLRSDASTPSHDLTAAGFVAFVIWISCSVPETPTPPPTPPPSASAPSAVAPARHLRVRVGVGDVELVERERAGHRQQAGELDRRVALDVQRQRRRRCRARTATRYGRPGRSTVAARSASPSPACSRRRRSPS